MKLATLAAIPLGVLAVSTSAAFADPDAALAELKREAWVKDIVYEPSAVVQWHIGMLKTGHPREFGYAETACNILIMNGVKTGWVRIVDVVAVVNGGATFRKASLGRVNCADWSRKHP